jgi:acyl transferase domain-containing protein
MSPDYACILGTACRLPGTCNRTDRLWQVFAEGTGFSNTPPPETRHLFNDAGQKIRPSKGGWLSLAGVEEFDPGFFAIPPNHARSLRPNIRLGLELTYEALESAGIPPQSLAGKPVSVSIGVGTEDGWDMKRWVQQGPDAFDTTWAASSDPSGVSGYISHFFGFTGSSVTLSNACASGAFALRAGYFDNFLKPFLWD